jgi:hypothetical protein
MTVIRIAMSLIYPDQIYWVSIFMIAVANDIPSQSLRSKLKAFGYLQILAARPTHKAQSNGAPYGSFTTVSTFAFRYL